MQHYEAKPLLRGLGHLGQEAIAHPKFLTVRKLSNNLQCDEKIQSRNATFGPQKPFLRNKS